MLCEPAMDRSSVSANGWLKIVAHSKAAEPCSLALLRSIFCIYAKSNSLQASHPYVHLSCTSLWGSAMSEVNVTELRQNLPDYLAEVRKGKELKITVRGKVIARIVPE